ncbi:MAG: hypothetical protein ABJA82_06490 [Myxococcales bacterium]
MAAQLPEVTKAEREASQQAGVPTPEAATKVRREAPWEAADQVPVGAVASSAAVVAVAAVVE